MPAISLSVLSRRVVELDSIVRLDVVTLSKLVGNPFSVGWADGEDDGGRAEERERSARRRRQEWSSDSGSAILVARKVLWDSYRALAALRALAGRPEVQERKRPGRAPKKGAVRLSLTSQTIYSFGGFTTELVSALLHSSCYPSAPIARVTRLAFPGHHALPSLLSCFTLSSSQVISQGQAIYQPTATMTTYTPFLLLTPRLLIVPTPFLLTVEPYLTFYASLHARHDFCNMAFGDHLPARQWSQEEQVDKVRGEVERNWTKGRGMGDMGVGLWSGRREGLGRVLQGCGEGEEEVRIVEGEEAERLVAEGKLWDEVEWSGYAGVREARLPPREEGDEPLPSWLERASVLTNPSLSGCAEPS